jgi:hypothetical protein
MVLEGDNPQGSVNSLRCQNEKIISSSGSKPNFEFGYLVRYGWPPNSATLASWRFDEGFSDKVTDDSPNSNDGTIYGATWTDGRFGNALKFDGVDDRVKLPNSVLNGLTDITSEFWVKTTDTVAGIVTGANSSNDNEYLIFWDSANEIELYIKGSRYTMPVIALTDDNWHHVAVVRAGSEVSVYVDGKFDGKWTGAPAEALSIEPDGLWLGCEQDSVGGGWETNQQFNGLIDEVRVYNRAVSPEEISAKYAEKSQIWVKVPSIPANGTATIYMHYGNPEATSASDAEAVFEFFDDFEGANLDTNKWALVDSSGWEVADGMLKGADTSGRIQPKVLFDKSTPMAVETRAMFKSEPGNGYQVLGTYKSSSDSAGILFHPGNEYYRNDSSWINWGSSVPSDTWFIIDQAITNGEVKFTTKREGDGYTYKQDVLTNSVDNEPITLGERYDDVLTGQGYEAYWDWISARQYTSPEPIIVVGEDTTPPAISQVEVRLVSGLSAIITWQTDEIASTQVKLGTASGNYTIEVSQPEYVLNHSITITGLERNTNYFFIVTSTDPSGNQTKSQEGIFTTATNLLLNGGGETETTLGWTVTSGNFTPQSQSPQPWMGKGYFAAQPDSSSSSMFQDLDISVYATAIDAGLFSLRAGAFIMVGLDGDEARFKVEYCSAEGEVLDSFDSGSVWNIAWQEHFDRRAVPVGTRTVRVIVEANRKHGNLTEVFFDNIYCLITEESPEPALGIALYGARPGEIMTICLTGLEPFEYFNLWYDNYDITPDYGAHRANSRGEAHFNWQVPWDAVGTHTFQAIGQQSSQQCSVKYTISSYQPSLTVAPEDCRPGEVITLTASDFAAGENLTLYFDDGPILEELTKVVGDSGNWQGTWLIPWLAQGEHTFSVVGQSSGAVAEVTYTIAVYTSALAATPEDC